MRKCAKCTVTQLVHDEPKEKRDGRRHDPDRRTKATLAAWWRDKSFGRPLPKRRLEFLHRCLRLRQPHPRRLTINLDCRNLPPRKKLQLQLLQNVVRNRFCHALILPYASATISPCFAS